MNKYLVYTCIASGYDVVFPPVNIEHGIDYIIFSDDESLNVSGWETRYISAANFPSPHLMNRYFKMLVGREIDGYDCSLYVDGNIRVIGGIHKLFSEFSISGKPLRFFKHPARVTIRQEIVSCISRGQADEPSLWREYYDYINNGFVDDVGLIEATIFMKNHNALDLDFIMGHWWSLYDKYRTRDQISLPYVLSMSDASYDFFDFNFRESNACFGIYPHFGDKNVHRWFFFFSARSYDSKKYAFLLKSWKYYWVFRRVLRRLGSKLNPVF